MRTLIKKFQQVKLFNNISYHIFRPILQVTVTNVKLKINLLGIVHITKLCNQFTKQTITKIVKCWEYFKLNFSKYRRFQNFKTILTHNTPYL